MTPHYESLAHNGLVIQSEDLSGTALDGDKDLGLSEKGIRKHFVRAVGKDGELSEERIPIVLSG